MRKFGIIGKPAQHSFSPEFFNKKFDRENIEATYHYYEIPEVKDLQLLFNLNLQGLNVTSPFKRVVIPYLDGLDPSAEAAGAVNTIKISEKGKIGYNTDIHGFKESLKNTPFKQGIDCLILGTGGAASAVALALRQLNCTTTFVSRTNGELTYSTLSKDQIQNCQMIVNATPLGMHPLEGHFPDIPYRYLNTIHFVYDLIYNPEKTLFLAKAEQQGAYIKNGYDMLRYQAEKSWQIWNH